MDTVRSAFTLDSSSMVPNKDSETSIFFVPGRASAFARDEPWLPPYKQTLGPAATASWYGLPFIAFGANETCEIMEDPSATVVNVTDVAEVDLL